MKTLFETMFPEKAKELKKLKVINEVNEMEIKSLNNQIKRSEELTVYYKELYITVCETRDSLFIEWKNKNNEIDSLIEDLRVYESNYNNLQIKQKALRRKVKKYNSVFTISNIKKAGAPASTPAKMLNLQNS